MTLTEQWKKGELKDGYYYAEDGGEELIIHIQGKNGSVMGDDFNLEATDWIKPITPVPSYEEWQQLHKFLEEFNALDVTKENQQLKGYNEYLRNIIKECEPYIENVCTVLNMEKFANGDFLHKSNEVLSKIRTAIGEK